MQSDGMLNHRSPSCYCRKILRLTPGVTVAVALALGPVSGLAQGVEPATCTGDIPLGDLVGVMGSAAVVLGIAWLGRVTLKLLT